MGREVRKVRNGYGFVTDLPGKLAYFLMWTSKEVFQQAQFVDHVQRRRMHSVAAEVAQEVGMLFKNDYVNAYSCEEKTQHHACWASANYAALRIKSFCHGIRRSFG